MNCRGWNPHIALFVEGDLEANLVHQLEAHLNVCDECRTFVDGLRKSQDGVRQLKGEIVDTAVLNRVRGRVLEQVRAIERRRTWMDRAAIWVWGGLRWRYAVLGGIVLILSAIGVWRLTVVNKPTPSAIQLASTPAAVPPVSIQVPNQTENAAARPRRLKPAPTPGSQAAAGGGFSRRVRESATEPAPVEHKDTVVQILTDDPNVVIYWLIDETGGF